MNVRIHVDAARELDEDASWYEEARPGLGADLLDEATRAVATIAEGPTIWTLARRSRTIRQFHLSRFPYTLF